MREAFFIGLTLLFFVAGPAAAQEIYGIEPGMPFPAAKAELEIAVQSATRDSSDGIYRWTFNTKQGTVTITASRDAFGSFSEARVQWIGLTAVAKRTSEATIRAACTRFRKRWKEVLGPPKRDSLEIGAAWRWDEPRLQARILCRPGGQAELILMTEPVLLSGTFLPRQAPLPEGDFLSTPKLTNKRYTDVRSEQ